VISGTDTGDVVSGVTINLRGDATETTTNSVGYYLSRLFNITIRNLNKT
jgi:hypothetical protein